MDIENNVIFTLSMLMVTWFAFYLVAKMLKLERFGVDLHPHYVIYKSTRLNAFINKLGSWNPKLWKVLGNIGIALFPGQVIFMSYLLFLNLYKFLYVPQEATPVMPLIPGVTISLQSLPWFLAAAGVVILLHELGHGILCVVEGVSIKSAALLFAVVTFGGAVEPDQDAMDKASLTSKIRILASGSLINLVTGLLLIIIFFLTNGSLPPTVGVFFNWLYFLSINLSLVNMLPVYPLDGGQILRTYMASLGKGAIIERVAMYGFLTLMASNLVLSLIKFGLIPL